MFNGLLLVFILSPVSWSNSSKNCNAADHCLPSNVVAGFGEMFEVNMHFFRLHDYSIMELPRKFEAWEL